MIIDEFYNKHEGNRGWVVGNGPSINHQRLSRLSSEPTFASNRFFLNDSLTPFYYCIEDRLRMRQDCKRIDAWRPQVAKFVPRDLVPFLRRHDDVVPINLVREKNLGGEYRFSSDCAKEVCWGSQVTFMMLQLAVYMGCNPIYLIGLDGVKEGKPKHFYGNDKQKYHKAKYDKLEAAMATAVEYCRTHGIVVLNATPNPVRHFFPLVEMESVLGT